MHTFIPAETIANRSISTESTAGAIVSSSPFSSVSLYIERTVLACSSLNKPLYFVRSQLASSLLIHHLSLNLSQLLSRLIAIYMRIQRGIAYAFRGSGTALLNIRLPHTYNQVIILSSDQGCGHYFFLHRQLLDETHFFDF